MPINRNNSTAVGMRQVAATSSNAQRTWLWSGGAADCVILAAYNKTTKTAFLVHIDRLMEDGDWAPPLTESMKGKIGVDIYIASEAVGNNPNNALLKRLCKKADEMAGWIVHTPFDSGKLAICADGTVDVNFDPKPNGLNLIPPTVNTSFEVQRVSWSVGGSQMPSWLL